MPETKLIGIILLRVYALFVSLYSLKLIILKYNVLKEQQKTSTELTIDTVNSHILRYVNLTNIV